MCNVLRKQALCHRRRTGTKITQYMRTASDRAYKRNIWFQRKVKTLILRILIIIAADDILIFFLLYFSVKIRLVISCESSARQTTRIKWQVLFSLKNNNRMSPATILISALRFDQTEHTDENLRISRNSCFLILNLVKRLVKECY